MSLQTNNQKGTLKPMHVLWFRFKSETKGGSKKKQRHQPTNQPTNQTASQPASKPANQPTSQPASQPANQPHCRALQLSSASNVDPGSITPVPLLGGCSLQKWSASPLKGIGHPPMKINHLDRQLLLFSMRFTPKTSNSDRKK